MLFGVDAIMTQAGPAVNLVGNCVRHRDRAVWERAIPADAPIFLPPRGLGAGFGAADAEVVNSTSSAPSASRPTSHAIAGRP